MTEPGGCQSCGCCDLRFVSARAAAAGWLLVRRRCRHCGRLAVRRERDPAAEAEERSALDAALTAWKCPKCGATNPLVTSTQGQIRYVRCRLCRHGGKVSCPTA